MDREEVLEKVKDVIVEHLSVKPEQIQESSRFIEDFQVDSLGIAELLMAFEAAFPIPDISDKDANQITTVGETVDYIIENQVQPVS